MTPLDIIAQTIAGGASSTGYRGRVSRSGDFRRIEALPRRKWHEAADLEALRVKLTHFLKTPEGRWELWSIQAAALRELYDIRGLFAPIAVGKGKALISLLAPVVLGAKRPLLIVPASLRDQTIDIVIPEMRQHWKLHDNLAIRGYEELCRVDRSEAIEGIEPDLIILDEAQYAKNKAAAVVRRIDRYLVRKPTTIVVVLSGSMADTSLRDYWHLARWSLGDRLVPMPTSWQELSDWADALDEKVRDGARAHPGALLEWISPKPFVSKDGESEPASLKEVRAAYRQRLIETPGVISTGKNEISAALRIDGVYFPVDPRITRLLHELRTDWADPNGDPIMEAVHLWRVARQLALGFWLRWEPKPPRDWLEARTNWGRYVRNIVRHNRRNIDTEKQVWDDCEKKSQLTHPPREAAKLQPFFEWCRLRDTYEPTTVVEWVSDFALDVACDWLEQHPGVVWVDNPDFGKRLANRAGVHYYGGGDSTIAHASGPIVASVKAHGTGKNLQQWSRHLAVSPASSGKIWEQLIGRPHRPGQKAGEVVFEVFQHVLELRASFSEARARAKFIEQTMGMQQKLCYADCSIPLEVN